MLAREIELIYIASGETYGVPRMTAWLMKQGFEVNELAHRRRWATRADARRDLIRWIEGWFNARRLHSSNDYNSPIDWENLYYRRGDGIAA